MTVTSRARAHTHTHQARSKEKLCVAVTQRRRRAPRRGGGERERQRQRERERLSSLYVARHTRTRKLAHTPKTSCKKEEDAHWGETHIHTHTHTHTQTHTTTQFCDKTHKSSGEKCARLHPRAAHTLMLPPSPMRKGSVGFTHRHLSQPPFYKCHLMCVCVCV